MFLNPRINERYFIKEEIGFLDASHTYIRDDGDFEEKSAEDYHM